MFKSVRSVHGGHHGLYPIGQTNICIFSMKFLKFYLTGVWNESCSIARVVNEAFTKFADRRFWQSKFTSTKWYVEVSCSIQTTVTWLSRLSYLSHCFQQGWSSSIHKQFACGWTFTTCGRTTARTQARLANTHTKDTIRLILWTDCTLRTTAWNRHVFIVNHRWNQGKCIR